VWSLVQSTARNKLFKAVGEVPNRPRTRELGREKVIVETRRNIRINIYKSKLQFLDSIPFDKSMNRQYRDSKQTDRQTVSRN